MLAHIKNTLTKSKISILLDVLLLVYIGSVLYQFIIFVKLPLTQLIQLVPDDTFYYLKIVENAHQLNFISFDGINATSGFHYLHFFLLYLAHFLKPTKEIFILFASTISLCGYLLGISVLWATLKKQAKTTACLLFISGLLLSNFEKVIFMGLETGLAIAAFSLVFYVWQNDLSKTNPAKHYTVIQVTAVMFLALCSRLDLFLVLIVFSAIYYLVTAGNLRKRLTYIFATSIALGIHCVITYILCGHLFPDSGSVKSSLKLLEYHQEITTWSLSVYHDLHSVFLNKLMLFIQPILSLYYFIWIFTGTAAILFIYRWKDKQWWIPMGLLLSYLCIGGTYMLFSTQVQIWYFVLPALCLLLSGSLFIDSLMSKYKSLLSVKTMAIFSILILMFTYYGSHTRQEAQYPWQLQMYHLAFELKTLYKEQISGNLGVWNAGIISYFSDLPIVNLDGLVNTNIRALINRRQPGTTSTAIRDQNIDFILDWRNVFNEQITRFFVGDKFLRHSLKDESFLLRNQDFRLYKVVDHIDLPKYEINTEINFQKKSFNADKWIESGWGYAEDAGTWTIARQASLELNKLPRDQNLLFNIDLIPFIAPNKLSEQKVDIYLNEVLLGTVKTADAQHFKLLIPTELINGEQDIFKLVIGTPTSPKDLGISTDTRKLGIRVKSIRISPTPDYSLDESINFTQESFNADKWLSSGWSSPEVNGTWTLGNNASLFLKSPDLIGQNPQRLKLKATINPFLNTPQLATQQVDVSINNKLIGQWNVDLAQEYTMTIPTDIVADPLLHITFTIPQATSPASLGMNGDTRKLGILFKKLVIEAQ